MSSTEKVFLENSRKLYQALKVSAPQLQGRNIEHQDLSQLAYNYHVDNLSWSQKFVREGAKPPEIFRVTLSIEYLEPADLTEIATVQFSVTAEIFQNGAISRVVSSESKTEKLDDQLLRDLDKTIMDLLEAGWRRIDEAIRK